jgi:hypothetical protein
MVKSSIWLDDMLDNPVTALFLLSGPLAGVTAAQFHNALTRPSEADYGRIRMTELTEMYKRMAAHARQRALQMQGANI